MYSDLINDNEDLLALNLALQTLNELDVNVGPVEQVVEQSGTALEAPALRVKCQSMNLTFELSYSGFDGETTLEMYVQVFDDNRAIEFGDPEDLRVRNFISWLKHNSPTKIAIQRTYGRLVSESDDFEMPDFPQREAAGGSVLLYVPLLTHQMEASSKYLESGRTGDSLSDAVSRAADYYFHKDSFRDTELMRLPEVVPAVLAFMRGALIEAGVRGATLRHISR